MQICVELVATIHAHHHIAASIEPGLARPSVYNQFDRYFHDSICAKAIELSINFRVMNERLEDSDIYRKMRDAVSPIGAVGRLIDPSKTPLSLHDCCNKIIHCKKFEFKKALYTTRWPDGNLRFQNPCHDTEIILFGNKSGEHWKCLVDLQKLSEHSHSVLDIWCRGDLAPFQRQSLSS